MTEHALFVHNDLLGHVPNPGFCGPGYGNSFHTIDADGLRSNGETPVSGGSSILAVGDSFTYGDEVRDEETWPAQLQRLTGRRVFNGGVTGYGFDQTILRAEQLAPTHKPAVVVVSFIADDIRRTEASRMWWRDKPWFAIERGELVLKGVPVPNRKRLPIHIRRRLDQILVDWPPALQHLVGYHKAAHHLGFGLELAQRLIERLAKMQDGGDVRLVVMAQYPPHTWVYKQFEEEQRQIAGTLLDCATKCGLATLDTFRRLAVEPKPLDFYAATHMNARGNQAIASLLAARLPELTEQSTGAPAA